MDMSFANQALAAEYLLKHSGDMSGNVYDMPEELDREIAALKLRAMGIEIDTLTAEQESLPERVDSWHSRIRLTPPGTRAAVRRTANEQHVHDPLPPFSLPASR